VFEEGMEKTRRIYPHLDPLFDGFFVAKFKKLGDGEIGRSEAVKKHLDKMEEQLKKKKNKKV